MFCRFALQSNLQSRPCVILNDVVRSNCDPCLCNKNVWSLCIDRYYVNGLSTTLWTYSIFQHLSTSCNQGKKISNRIMTLKFLLLQHLSIENTFLPREPTVRAPAMPWEKMSRSAESSWRATWLMAHHPSGWLTVPSGKQPHNNIKNGRSPSFLMGYGEINYFYGHFQQLC